MLKVFLFSNFKILFFFIKTMTFFSLVFFISSMLFFAVQIKIVFSCTRHVMMSVGQEI